MNNDKNSVKSKLVEFLDNKGFYIVLLLCVGIITLTAFVVTRRNIASYMDNNPFADMASEIGDITAEDELLVLDDIQNIEDSLGEFNKDNLNSVDETKRLDSAINSENVSTNNNGLNTKNNNIDMTDTVNDTPVAVTVNPLNDLNLTLPVQGEIIKAYTKDSLLYSKTLEQWTTHQGIDIAAARGTPVKASRDGVILDVYNDSGYGITVIIDHGNGIQTKYSNLSTNEMVQKGVNIKTGDVISGVGNTALFESLDNPHIHFELLQNGLNINPTDYIK